jgi:MFS family permease
MFVCMFGTAITELFTGQWIDVLLKNVTDNSLLILTLTAGIMVIGRGMAGPIVHRLSPQGVLLISIILASVGLYLLSTLTGNAIFIAAIIFGTGVCYLWPTMLGLVAEYIPRSGALGMNLMGGAGTFAVSVYTLFMGRHYDGLIVKHLPANAAVEDYLKAPEGSAMANTLMQAKSLAGPEVLQATLIIPVVLIVAFGGLFYYLNRYHGIRQPVV